MTGWEVTVPGRARLRVSLRLTQSLSLKLGREPGRTAPAGPAPHGGRRDGPVERPGPVTPRLGPEAGQDPTATRRTREAARPADALTEC